MYLSFVTMTTDLSLSLPVTEPASIVFDPDASCFMPAKAESKRRGENKEWEGVKKHSFFLQL
jgi:hypothetical protein